MDDDNLLVSFDRGIIQEYAGELAAGVYKVRVYCSLNVECNGEPYTLILEGTDSVEILVPGKKK
jgi:hypothetical protein